MDPAWTCTLTTSYPARDTDFPSLSIAAGGLDGDQASVPLLASTVNVAGEDDKVEEDVDQDPNKAGELTQTEGERDCAESEVNHNHLRPRTCRPLLIPQGEGSENARLSPTY